LNFADAGACEVPDIHFSQTLLQHQVRIPSQRQPALHSLAEFAGPSQSYPHPVCFDDEARIALLGRRRLIQNVGGWTRSSGGQKAPGQCHPRRKKVRG